MLGVAAAAVIAGGTAAGVRWSKRDIVTVQTGLALRGDLLAVVTASGEIKPLTYINISAEYQGQLTAILVKEGDRVRRGQLLARCVVIS